jgi:hypothetical protein
MPAGVAGFLIAHGEANMSRPEARIALVRLDINTATDFTRRFGKQVREAGGKYDDVRGPADRRFVYLPWERRDLIDAIVTQYPHFRKTTIVLDRIEGSYNGVVDHRVSGLFGPNQTVLYWSKDLGVSPSDQIEGFFSRVFDRFDWPKLTDRWDADDRAAAERRREHSLRQDLEELKVRIAAESLRILDGANDIDGLKDLAREFRETCAELGIDEPGNGSSETAGLRA